MKLKQLFCVHPCFEDEKHYGRFSGDYVYQCPICGAYMAHYRFAKKTFRISKKCYDYYIARMQGEKQT